MHFFVSSAHQHALRGHTGQVDAIQNGCMSSHTFPMKSIKSDFFIFFSFKYSKMKFVTWLDCFPPFPARCEKEWATCSRRGPGWGTWQGHEGRWRWLSVVGAEQSGDPEGRRRVDSSEPSQSWKRRTELWKVSRDEPGYYTGHFKPFRPEPQVSLDSGKIDVNKYIIKYIRNMVFFQTSANQERQGCL